MKWMVAYNIPNIVKIIIRIPLEIISDFPTICNETQLTLKGY